MTTTKDVRCRLGIHSWVRRHPPDERYEGPDQKVCRRCGKQTRPADVPPGVFGPG
ncbi:hypothetical protein [Petropleomorpha daqingensis]|uniref:Uncharacterized protein n=1 Tax=Petropleomorpha daqingensis TaxID=2026353 RepID=A0A853CQ48_9ACTN|nr:hypothetical protein [Petropleomorpha daqingensis]NYJ08889.1 hypothetical protein [Petropleomorpha daqingensis]